MFTLSAFADEIDPDPLKRFQDAKSLHKAMNAILLAM